MRIIFMKGIGTQVSQQCWGTAGGPSLLEGRQSHSRGFHIGDNVILMTKSFEGISYGEKLSVTCDISLNDDNVTKFGVTCEFFMTMSQNEVSQMRTIC